MAPLTTFRVQFRSMGSHNEVVVAARDAESAQTALDKAVAEVQRIEQKYSRYRQDSVLSRINAHAGASSCFPCDSETQQLLEIADLLYRQSSGLFDITSGILRRAWDFKQKTLPTPQHIAELLPKIGWPKIKLTTQGVELPEAGMEIDLGGIAKEYAADCAADCLRQQGLSHGYVNLGGDIAVIGPQADGSPWRIGIRHPRTPGKLMASIPLTQGALATSGDYERFFEHNGQRYCHILNPQTGYPCSHWQSVSVVAPRCMVAGATATIAMLHEQQGQAFLQATRHPYLAVNPHGHLISNTSPSQGTS